MKKYKVKIAKEFASDRPFVTSWDYETIGDELRSEFDEHFAKMEKEGGVIKGGMKQMWPGEELKGFMVRKKINLVTDDSNGLLKSVFLLNHGEEKIIDERARKSLARYEKKKVMRSDGTGSSWLGFLEFEEVGEKENIDEKKIEVQGEDLEYFKEKKEKFACEVCGKEFDTKQQLNGHKISHKKK